MIYLLLPPLTVLGSFYLLWIFFLAVMNLARAKDAGTLSRPALLFGLPLLWIGLVIDFLVNVFILSLVMLELPAELTVTSRLSRHFQEPSGFRRSLSVWVCKNLLDAFDPSGNHCK